MSAHGRNRSRFGGTRYLDYEHYAYGEFAVSELARRFSIWHIHGEASRPQTIKISNEDYASMLSRYRRLSSDDGTASWRSIFFNNDLVILGLQMGPDEFPLRWLLVERMKRIAMMPHQPRTVYVKKRNELDDDINRMFFFKSLGIEVDDSAESYEELYRPFGVA